jgi:hypothetical protein
LLRGRNKTILACGLIIQATAFGQWAWEAILLWDAPDSLMLHCGSHATLSG